MVKPYKFEGGHEDALAVVGVAGDFSAPEKELVKFGFLSQAHLHSMLPTVLLGLLEDGLLLENESAREEEIGGALHVGHVVEAGHRKVECWVGALQEDFVKSYDSNSCGSKDERWLVFIVVTEVESWLRDRVVGHSVHSGMLAALGGSSSSIGDTLGFAFHSEVGVSLELRQVPHVKFSSEVSSIVVSSRPVANAIESANLFPVGLLSSSGHHPESALLWSVCLQGNLNLGQSVFGKG